MSVLLPLIVAAHLNDVSVALPSLDGASGVQAGYERFMPERKLGLGVSLQMRRAAVGDYTGMRYGVGVEGRWYWRGDAWLSTLPAGNMVGWFVGARFDVALDATHDDVMDRSLGTTLELGGAGSIGYRIAPWRGLEITPSVALTRRWDIDLSGRLPAWGRGGIAAGLSVGWLF